MNLYRMLYLRGGQLRGHTFAARDAASASRLAEVWAEAIHAVLLTVKFERALQGQLELQP